MVISNLGNVIVSLYCSFMIKKAGVTKYFFPNAFEVLDLKDIFPNIFSIFLFSLLLSSDFRNDTVCLLQVAWS